MALTGELPRLDSPDGLHIEVREQGTTIAIEMAGEWDLAARDAARHVIARALAERPECVLLDLSRLEFIDSSGLHVTIELARRSAAQSVRLVIIPGAQAVQRVFEITGLLERLPFIDEQPTGSRTASSRRAGTAQRDLAPAPSPPPEPDATPRRPSPIRTRSVRQNLTRS